MEIASTVTGYFGAFLIAICACTVTYEVFSRYYLVHPHTWALEANVFLLIGATFAAAAFTQLKRGHVGTEVLDLILPKRWIPWRVLCGDVLACLLCAFIGIQVAFYAVHAWREGWTTDSVWAPHLWIPHAVIAAGMLLITLQYVVQIVEQIIRLSDPMQKAPTR
ncbi:MAG TPA: TRAP transporter small permease [Burkholderiaceae bacterium]|nr:TRAP transporter small permease [Burkholderiaceae bacterium]